MNPPNKLKSLLITLLFVGMIGGFFVTSRLLRPPEISESERRPLEKMPEAAVTAILNGEYMLGFDKYAADSFPFRESFRTLKAYSVFNLFCMSDKNGLYIEDAGAGKFEKIDKDSMGQTAEKIKKLAESMDSVNVYYAVIPDKSIYAGGGYPGFNKQDANAILSRSLGDFTCIDLAAVLSLDMFYKTDVHWDQVRIAAVAKALTDAMGAPMSADFKENTVGEFKGIYPGQLALPMESDTMSYYTSDVLDNAEVRILDERTFEFVQGTLYDHAAFAGQDPYDFFLNGAQPLIEIVNRAAENKKTLYIFRDSFTSSLAPLLVPSYAKVTLIDLRYLDARLLSEFVEMEEDADVLFLYSSQILNNSSVLLIN